MEEALEETPEKRKDIEDSAAILFLEKMLMTKTASDKIVKICSDDESIDDEVLKTTFPRIVACGTLHELEPFYLVAESKVLLKFQKNVKLSFAVIVLLGAYYVFNINYQVNFKNFFFFLETILLEKKEHRGKVTIAKFLHQLS